MSASFTVLIFLLNFGLTRGIGTNEQCTLGGDDNDSVTTEIPSPETPVDCRVDIVLSIDSSASLNTDFCREIEFVRTLVNQFDVGPNKAQFGSVYFSSQAFLNFGLKAFFDKSGILQALATTPFLNLLTNHEDAIKKMTAEMDANNRPGVPRVSIFLTDGQPTAGNQDLTAVMPLVTSRQIFQVAVGFGDIQEDTLLILAQGNPNRVFKFETLSQALANSTLIKGIANAACESVQPTVNCTEWGAWSGCGKTCGMGVKSRTRTCRVSGSLNQGFELQSMSDVAVCGSDELPPCPVNGNWGSWCCQWGKCSVTCGGGTQTRTRVCDNPAPANGGAPCEGESTETQDCNTQPCPEWSSWGDWGNCSAACDYGKQTRTRQCLNAPVCPKCGPPCPGPSEESRPCIEKCCCPKKQSLLPCYCRLPHPPFVRLQCPYGGSLFIDDICVVQFRQYQGFELLPAALQSRFAYCAKSLPELKTVVSNNCNGKPSCNVKGLCEGPNDVVGISYSCCMPGNACRRFNYQW